MIDDRSFWFGEMLKYLYVDFIYFPQEYQPWFIYLFSRARYLTSGDPNNITLDESFFFVVFLMLLFADWLLLMEHRVARCLQHWILSKRLQLHGIRSMVLIYFYHLILAVLDCWGESSYRPCDSRYSWLGVWTSRHYALCIMAQVLGIIIRWLRGGCMYQQDSQDYGHGCKHWDADSLHIYPQSLLNSSKLTLGTALRYLQWGPWSHLQPDFTLRLPQGCFNEIKYVECM